MLLALLIMAIAVAPATRTAGGKGSEAVARGPAVTGAPPTTALVTTAATDPGAVTGVVNRAQAGGGCGFSLGAAGGASPVGRCTVLEVGDSIGNDIGWGLARQVTPSSGVNLVQLDKSASGLANTAFYDWPARLTAYLGQYHPQLVLISIGADDEQGMTVNGSSLQFPSPAWKAAYLKRLTQLVGEATASGAYVLWVGMPIMGPSGYNQGIQVLNALDQQAVTSQPNATYVSTWSLFANPAGSFQSSAVVNGAWSSLRQSDGIHLSLVGENVIATYVVHEIAQIYHVALAPADAAVISSWA